MFFVAIELIIVVNRDAGGIVFKGFSVFYKDFAIIDVISSIEIKDSIKIFIWSNGVKGVWPILIMCFQNKHIRPQIYPDHYSK